jgi:ribosomal protein S18 acetylase RimI-like enzyme
MTEERNKILFKKGTLADLKPIQQLSLLAYGKFKDILTEENWRHWEENFNDENTFRSLFEIATCFICLCGTEVVGVAFFIPRNNPYKFFHHTWSYIRLVGVNPKFASQGIGKTLTRLCIEEAKQTGETTIALHTSEFQDAARHIYESLGFKKEKEFMTFDKKYWIYTLALNKTNHG